MNYTSTPICLEILQLKDKILSLESTISSHDLQKLKDKVYKEELQKEKVNGVKIT